MSFTPRTRSRILPLADIDRQDTSYCLRPPSDREPDPLLRDSIEKFGILQPPLLLKEDKRFIILSGRKRVETASGLGWNELPCLVVEKNIDLFQICETMLIHALIGNRLSPVEQAVFFKKMQERLSEAEQLALLPLFGIKAQPYKLRELVACLQLDKRAVNALHVGHIHQKTADKLAKLSKKDQQTVIRLIEQYRLGGSKQQKLVGAAIELVMRTGHPFEDFADRWLRQEDQQNANPPQQTTALLNALDKMCFPARTKAEEEFTGFCRSAGLPENTSLQHTTSFEDDRLTLSIVFEDKESFLKRWEGIRKNL